MLALKQKQPNPEASQRKVKLRWNVLLGDLSLLMSLTVARFIIWRTLRRCRQERAARRKQFKLIHGSDHRANQRVIPS
jgi:ABC-type nickel/cobalt efflux system permease component RcnA